jgi:hypothetical protein
MKILEIPWLAHQPSVRASPNLTSSFETCSTETKDENKNLHFVGSVLASKEKQADTNEVATYPCNPTVSAESAGQPGERVLAGKHQ